MNVFGTIRVTKAFAPLIRRTQGRITNVSSIAGRCIIPFSSAYCISKFGVEAFSLSLRYEMRPFNVKVCTIEPGNHITATGLGEDVENMLRSLWNNLSDDSVRQDYGQKGFEHILKSAQDYGQTAVFIQMISS